MAVLHELPTRVRFRLPAALLQPGRRDEIAAALRSRPGVAGTRFNASARTLVVDREPGLSTAALARAIRSAQAASPARSRTVAVREPKRVREIVPIVAGCVLAAAGQPLAVPVLALASLPIARRAAARLVGERRAGVDLLDSIAIGLTLGTGQVGTAAGLTALIEVGEWMRELTASRSRRALGALMHDEGATAWKIKAHRRVAVPVGQLGAGDVIAVHPGDRIPVDGVVLAGRAGVDERFLTGEAIPAMREPGDRVFAMTVVAEGELRVRAEGDAGHSRAGQIVRFLEEAPIADTRMSDHARRVADRLVLPTLGLASVVGLVTGSLSRVASIVIFDLATGIRVAAPTTMLASLLGAAREGVLIKGAATLERLARVDAVVFDKTGTLTLGRPSVSRVMSFNGVLPDDLVGIAAAADRSFSHPFALAVTAEAERLGLELPEGVSRDYRVGMGVEAELLRQGRRERFLVGNRRLIEEAGVSTAAIPHDLDRMAGISRVYVADARECLGAILLKDTERHEAAAVVAELRRRGVRHISLLTGDSRGAAEHLAGSLAVDSWRARATPEDKAQIVRDLKDQGHTVAVVGDGINDGLAFALADVAVAMSGGADLATSSAQVVLIDDDLRMLPLAMDRARQAMGIMRQNLAIIAAPNVAGLAGSTLTAMNPAAAALLNNGSTILAAANGLRPLARRNTHAG